MIKFFRKIRQKMLTENKFSKYLIYAIGEIVLVVIGILIALQINNWNENKTKTKKEIFHLENILSNLQDDLKNQISPCIEKTGNQILGYDLLKSGFYEKNNISNDSIRRLLFQFLSQWDLVLNTVAFDNLKSTGMDILSNDSIKSKLLTIYGNDYKYLQSLKDSYDKSHYDGVTTILGDNTNLWDELTDVDKEFLRTDKRLITKMRAERSYQLLKYLNEMKDIKPKSQDLIENIKIEIIQLKEK